MSYHQDPMTLVVMVKPDDLATLARHLWMTAHRLCINLQQTRIFLASFGQGLHHYSNKDEKKKLCLGSDIKRGTELPGLPRIICTLL
jgi:hypothetical protein